MREPPPRSPRTTRRPARAPPIRAPSTSGSDSELGGVVGLHRAAVEDPHLVAPPPCRALHAARGRTRSPPGPARASRSAGADRPDRLVGDHDLVRRRSLGTSARPGLELAQLAPRCRRRALLLGLADAEDRRSRPALERRAEPSAAAPRRSRRRTGGARSGRGSRLRRRAPSSIGAETSPVKAPESLLVHVLGDTPARADAARAGRPRPCSAVNGGQTTTSTSSARGDARQQRLDELRRLGDRSCSSSSCRR